MELPETLRSALESRAGEVGIPACAKAAQALSARYRTENGSGKRLVTTETEAVGYALTRMPATFGAVYASLGWALAHTGLRPRTLLDVGAGTGAAAWAADALLQPEQVTCVEREGVMLQTGRALMAGTPLQAAKWLPGDVGTDALPCRAGLVVASYLCNELRPEALPGVLQKLWDATQEMFLLVEPGTPAGFAVIRRIRAGLTARGAQIAAPCPHMGPCPIAGDDWCHFTCRVARSRLHRQMKGGDAPYEDEKFCYLALTRQPAGRAAARIMRHPYVEPGKITLQLCTAEGLARRVVRKREGEAFKAARKAGCGDVFSFAEE